MKLTDNEVEQLYLDVSAEYNTTPLAVNDGWIHHTMERPGFDGGSVSRIT